ncbi:MAG: ribosome biogenesis GTPase Der [Terracidiphilus sp.]|nr:ribosome biogenesis GTPase Der [Terracidiphilus sp.]
MTKYRRSVVPGTPGAAALPLVAIVGRPNVGKSTLFNRLTRSRRSIVGDEPGITRDRIYGEYEWAGRQFRLVDTGGIVPDDPELIPTEIYAQAKVALEEADALVLVVDARTELASPDYDLVRLLLRGGKPVFLAANKVESEAMAAAAENYRQLVLRNVFAISSEHGLGIGDMLDAISDAIPAPPEAVPTKEEVQAAREAEAAEDAVTAQAETAAWEGTEEDAEVAEPHPDEKALHRSHGEFEIHETSVAIIGRPNVGKSTLLNALTGTSRAIVSPVAGTTRDAVDELVEFEGSQFRFVDTAGIRRKGKTHLMAEKMSVVMARRHLEAADVALLILDATDGVTAADATIGGYAHESGRSVIIVVNKWDAVTTGRTDGKPPADREIFETQLRSVLKYLSYAPVVFLSALEGTGMGRVLNEVKSVAAERRKRVTTGQMNRFLEKIDFQRASVPMSKRVRIFYMTQAAVAPPTFILFTDRDIKLHFSFERFLENQIREAFGFKGTPIWFKVRARNAEKKE